MKTENRLLAADAVINHILGLFLLFYPEPLVRALGLPQSGSGFYQTILAGVLIGIGVALQQASRGNSRGLGLDGAIAINLCGGGILTAWLVAAPQTFSPTGRITLWVVAVLVVGIACVELIHRRKD